VRHSRLGKRGLPPLGLAGVDGSIGSIKCHNASGSNGVLMNAHVSTEGAGLADYEVNRECGFVTDSKRDLGGALNCMSSKAR